MGRGGEGNGAGIPIRDLQGQRGLRAFIFSRPGRRSEGEAHEKIHSFIALAGGA